MSTEAEQLEPHKSTQHSHGGSCQGPTLDPLAWAQDELERPAHPLLSLGDGKFTNHTHPLPYSPTRPMLAKLDSASCLFQQQAYEHG